MITSVISDFCQKYVKILFFKFGLSVFHHPIIYLIAGIIVTILCGLGLLNAGYENDSSTLWVPKDSAIWKNKETQTKYFGETTFDAGMIIEQTTGKNLMTPEYITIVYKIFLQTINNVTYEEKGKIYTYNDFCTRDYPSSPTCDVFDQGFFSLFSYTPLFWSTEESIITQINLFPSLTAVM